MAGGATWGFASARPGTGERFAVYAERALPANRGASVARNSAFSDLHHAIFLGAHANQSELLTTDVNHFPISGDQATVRVPFGDTVLTTVVTARTPLGGTLSARLPRIIALLAFTDGLVERRYEDLDVGLGRFEEAVQANHGHPLDELVSQVVTDLAGDTSEDDIAILAVTWG